MRFQAFNPRSITLAATLRENGRFAFAALQTLNAYGPSWIFLDLIVTDLTFYLADVIREVQTTASRFADLYDHRVDSHPIPYFGRVDKAVALTVGVNPSAGEFRGRGWSPDIDADYLNRRLYYYFENPQVPPHPWFRGWESALRELGVTYESGEAAHVDLSPRATVPMSQLDPQRFLDMVRHDIKMLFNLFALLERPRLLLMAGTVTKKFYVNDFIRKYASNHGWAFEGEAERTGEGRVGFHQLISNERKFAVFFCSVSPSANNKDVLRKRVQEFRSRLRVSLEREQLA